MAPEFGKGDLVVFTLNRKPSGGDGSIGRAVGRWLGRHERQGGIKARAHSSVV